MTPTRKRPVVVFMVCGGVVLALACAILYFTSNHHAYNRAVGRCRQKDYRAALAILERLSPSYQDSPKGTYLGSFCKYNLALESYELKKYDESLQYLVTIPDSYPKYDEVKDLRRKIEQKLPEFNRERERQRQLAEAKRQEERRKEEERAKHAQEEAAKAAAEEAAKPSNLDTFMSILKTAGVDNSIIDRVSQNGDSLTIVVANAWHYEPHQIRLQAAQNLWDIWARIRSPKNPDKARLELTDLNGNSVGGSRVLAGSLIWVKE